MKAKISGALQDATSEGFRRLLEEANRAATDGYELITVVRLDKKIAAVFRHVAPKTPPQGDAFFE